MSEFCVVSLVRLGIINIFAPMLCHFSVPFLLSKLIMGNWLSAIQWFCFMLYILQLSLPVRNTNRKRNFKFLIFLNFKFWYSWYKMRDSLLCVCWACEHDCFHLSIPMFASSHRAIILNCFGIILLLLPSCKENKWVQHQASWVYSDKYLLKIEFYQNATRILL